MGGMGRRIQLQHGAAVVTYDQDVITIGRDPSCGLALVDPSVSPDHAVLQRVAGEWLIRPERQGHTVQRRGEWLAGQRWTLLADGDVLQVGGAEVRVTLADRPELCARLIDLGALVSKVWPLEGPPAADRQAGRGLIIGRAADSAVRLTGQLCAPRHARLTLVDGSWWLTDLRSTSGTKVNGQKISDRRLAHGDELAIGGYVLAFVHHGRADGAFAPTAEQPKGAVTGGETVEQPALGDRETMVLERDTSRRRE
jgi:pSer/pThr/pTyr-binding forkhead associated (FHA) protein